MFWNHLGKLFKISTFFNWCSWSTTIISALESNATFAISSAVRLVWIPTDIPLKTNQIIFFRILFFKFKVSYLTKNCLPCHDGGHVAYNPFWRIGANYCHRVVALQTGFYESPSNYLEYKYNFTNLLYIHLYWLLFSHLVKSILVQCKIKCLDITLWSCQTTFVT